MKSLKLLLTASLISLLAVPTFASWREGGGGDPLALDFLEHARRIQTVHSVIGLQGLVLNEVDLNNKIVLVEQSLEGKEPNLVFPEGETISCFGEPKLGCVDETGKIKIARNGWINATTQLRLEVTAMELLMSLGVRGRYQLARSIATQVLTFSPEQIKARSFFEGLTALYRTGTLPRLAPLEGKLASGRCFARSTPSKPRATYLVVNRENREVGPVGTDQTYYGGIGIDLYGQVSPDRYDSVQREAIRPPFGLHKLRPIDSATLGYALPTRDFAHIRSSGGFIVAMIFDSRDQEPSYACYYFNIHP